MKTIIAHVEGVAPYSQGRPYEVDRLQGEGHDDYERRTWRNRMHVDNQGQVYIPPMAYKNALAETAKFLQLQIPGKGKNQYTKHFEAGVLAFEPAYLGIKVDAVQHERLFVPADGRPGGGTRVHKYFPRIEPGWMAEFKYLVFDDTVLQTWAETGQTVFEFVLTGCGQFVGLGRFRPIKRGFYGRFQVTGFAIEEGVA